MTDQVTILGATGSIGQNTLDVIFRHRERFQVWGLSAESRVEKLARVAVESEAKVVSIGAGRTREFRCALNGQRTDIRVVEGEYGLKCLAEMPESEVGSTHYRILFLAAFVLFIFTFVFNTIAEFVRPRLREKYSSL